MRFSGDREIEDGRPGRPYGGGRPTRSAPTLQDMTNPVPVGKGRSRHPRASGAVTLADVGLRCGVSKWTVSAALRGDPRLSPATVARIRTMAEEMNYDPSQHSAARRMALQKHGLRTRNHLAAFFFPTAFSQSDNYWHPMFRGVLEVLTHEKYELLMVGSQAGLAGGVGTATNLSQSFTRGDIDGAITLLGSREFPMAPALRACRGFANRPVVSLVSDQPGCACVTADYRAGARAAVRYLLALGHRHLLTYAFEGVPTMDAPNNRLFGVHQALSEAGLDSARHLHVLPIQVGDSEHSALARTDSSTEGRVLESISYGNDLLAHLRQHPKTSAILAFNDIQAIHIWYALRRAGIRVPEDISLIGFDDTDAIPGPYGHNILTTVRVPTFELGRAAATLLLKSIEEGTTCEETVVLPTELMERETTIGT